MRPLVGVLVGMALVVIASGAHAADPLPPESAPQDAPAPAPAPPPPPWGQPHAPPPPGYSPYGVPYAYPAGPGGAAYYYDSQKKNEVLALAIELFVPGVGSIYADHIVGALVTWGLTFGGIALLVWWVEQTVGPPDQPGFGQRTETASHDIWAVYVALAAIVSGRLYGFIDSYTSARDYNRRLRERLGIPDWSSLTLAPAPIRTDRAISWGPAVSFRF